MPTTPTATFTTRTFGAEIEFFGISNRTAAAALNAAGVPTEVEYYNHETRGHWKITTDGSVDGEGLELVSPILSGVEGLRTLALALRALAAAGARVNRSCGIHVHVGVDRNDGDAIRRIVDLYDRCERDLGLRGVLAPSRRSDSSGGTYYARTLDASLVEWARNPNAVARNGRAVADRQSGRYYGLNLQSLYRQPTVEFRAHQGSLDSEKVCAWVVLCVRLVETAVRAESVHFNSRRRGSSTGSAQGRFANLLVCVGLKAYSRSGYGEIDALCAWAGSYLSARRAHFAGESRKRIRGNLSSALDACSAQRIAA